MSYTVFLLDDPFQSSPESFYVEPDAEVSELVRDIRYDASSVSGLPIILLKYENVNTADGGVTIYDRVARWLRDSRSKTPLEYNKRLDQYFPHGPAPEGIDIVDVSKFIYDLIGSPVQLVSPRHPFHLFRADSSFADHYDRFGWDIEPVWQWQRLYVFWSSRTFEEELRKDIVPLAISEEGFTDPLQRFSRIAHYHDRLYVREKYRSLVRSARNLAREKGKTGVVIVGQPGTGKTTWLWYMLLCCFAKGENVVFLYKGQTRFFFDGRVYCAIRSSPEFPRDETFSAWCLIDSDGDLGPPPRYLTERRRQLFMVQTSEFPLKEDQVSGVVWGMDLWSFDELLKGLSIHDLYVPFLEALRNAIRLLAKEQTLQALIPSSDEPVPEPDIDPLHLMIAHNAIQEISATQAELGFVDNIRRGPIKEDPSSVKGQCRIRTHTLARALKFAKDGRGGWNSAEEVFKLLVKDAVYNFGNAPRDIKEAIFLGYSRNMGRITTAPILSRSDLDVLMDTLARLGKGEFVSTRDLPSYWLFAFDPRGPSVMSFQDDVFVPNFKSELVGRLVKKRFGRLAVEKARKFRNMFRLFPEGSSLADWIFESLVHDMVTSGNVPGKMFPMLRGDSSSPVDYILYESPPTFSSVQMFPARRRTIKDVAFPHDVSRWNNPDIMETYYCDLMPENNRLFDSFFVETKTGLGSVQSTVWIIKSTTSSTHGGLPSDFAQIRSIVNVVWKQAEELLKQRRAREKRCISAKTTVKRLRTSATKEEYQTPGIYVTLKYLYITPAPTTKRTWKLPADGWTSTTSGEVFVMYVDVADM